MDYEVYQWRILTGGFELSYFASAPTRAMAFTACAHWHHCDNEGEAFVEEALANTRFLGVSGRLL